MCVDNIEMPIDDQNDGNENIENERANEQQQRQPRTDNVNLRISNASEIIEIDDSDAGPEVHVEPLAIANLREVVVNIGRRVDVSSGTMASTSNQDDPRIGDGQVSSTNNDSGDMNAISSPVTVHRKKRKRLAHFI